MKAISIFLGFVIGIVTVTMAQESDSIVVTYDNQHTTIPVPEFGKQTTVKMADSIQVIEMSISRRKLSDIKQPALYPSNNVTVVKPVKKTKWYSQLEAGYTIGFISNNINNTISVDSYEFINLEPIVFNVNTDILKGYKLGLSIYEKERIINTKFSYISGFKLGFAQSFRESKAIPVVDDTIVHVFVGYEPIRLSRIQFLFPIGFRYHYKTGKSDSRLNIGTNIGSSIEYDGRKGYSGVVKNFRSTPLLLQPYLGLEVGKIGLLASTEIAFGSNYDYRSTNTINISIGLSLTYRFF